MDSQLRTAGRTQDHQATAQALLRAGDRDGAARELELELSRLERLTVLVTKTLEARLLNAAAMRAVDDSLPGLLAEQRDLIDRQIAVVRHLGELGWRVPAPV